MYCHTGKKPCTVAYTEQVRVTDGLQLILGYYDPRGQNFITLEANEADQCVACPHDSRISISQPANLVGSTMKAWYWREFRLPLQHTQQIYYMILGR